MKVKLRDIIGVADTNVRKTTGLTDVTELADSMETMGLIHSIAVRSVRKGKYEVTVGQRRWLAAKQLGWREIEATVKEIGDADAIAQSLAENIQRGDLEPSEEYDAYQKLMELDPKRFDKHVKIAKAVGKSHTYVDRIISAEELVRGLKPRTAVQVKRTPSREKRESGEEIPIRHATMVAQAFKHEDVKPIIEKLPKAEIRQKKEDLIKVVAPLDEFEARKVVNHFKMEPKRPIPEVKERALARETGVHIHTYLPPKVGRALERAAEDRHMTMEELIPIAVEEWLKRVGYYEKD